MPEKKTEEKKPEEKEKKGIASRIKSAVDRHTNQTDAKGVIHVGASGSSPKKKEDKKDAKEITAVADPFDTLSFVLMTERAIQLIEKQNKLVFIVRRSSTKEEIKNAAEAAFKSGVSDVRTLIDQKSRKKAFIKFAKEGDAGEIAIRLGII